MCDRLFHTVQTSPMPPRPPSLVSLLRGPSLSVGLDVPEQPGLIIAFVAGRLEQLQHLIPHARRRQRERPLYVALEVRAVQDRVEVLVRDLAALRKCGEVCVRVCALQSGGVPQLAGA